MDEKKEVTLTSVEQLNEYLNKTADDKSVISIVLELTGRNTADAATEGGAENG